MLEYVDGFTCCVGPVYAGYLAKSLPTWLDTLDSLTVVTKPDDADTLRVCEPHTRGRLRVVTTDVFQRHGAAFNKGAALTIAYAAMDPVDGVLHFDSDIHPPADWRRLAEREFRDGHIHGAVRTEEDGTPITDLGDWPYGYFQLWKADDPAARFWPLFEVWHPSAGGYDLEFLEHWPVRLRRKLSFRVVHYGEVRRNWFGVGLDAAAQREAFARMDRVHEVGLRKTRLQTRKPENRLQVPAFALRYSVLSDRGSPARLHDILRACMTDDPFLVEAAPGATAGKPGQRRIKVAATTPVASVREQVAAAYAARHGVAVAGS